MSTSLYIHLNISPSRNEKKNLALIRNTIATGSHPITLVVSAPCEHFSFSGSTRVHHHHIQGCRVIGSCPHAGAKKRLVVTWQKGWRWLSMHRTSYNGQSFTLCSIEYPSVHESQVFSLLPSRCRCESSYCFNNMSDSIVIDNMHSWTRINTCMSWLVDF